MHASFALLLGAFHLAAAAPGWHGHNGKCKQMAGEAGAAFALTNAPYDNQVVAFSRASDGNLTQVGMYSTGGAGQGVDFDSDYGLQLSPDNKYLYAVSPSSDTITVFSVQGSCLEKIQEIYGGDQPVSLTYDWDKKLMYALDQSVATPGIRGYRIGSGGTLSMINNQTVAISTPIGVPGTIIFTNNGEGLVVTNKIGSTLDYFSVDSNGEATLISTTASSGFRPFGAVLALDDIVFIAESGLPAFGNAAVSTYKPTTDGALQLITRSEKNEQTDACWIVVTQDKKYTYTANFVSGTVSSYTVASDGSVTILDSAAANQGNMSQPVDLALSSDGKYLLNLLRGYGSIAVSAIESDGSLTAVGNFGQGQGLPPNNGVSGLAAY